MKTTIFIVTFFLGCILANAQITTTIFENENGCEQCMQVNREIIPLVKIEAINADSLFFEDEKIEKQGGSFRYGVLINKYLNISNGLWLETPKKRIWAIKMNLEKAFTTSIIFSKLELLSNAELYVYSSNNVMLYGPVTSSSNIGEHSDRVFLTNAIVGNEVIVQLEEPLHQTDTSILEISNVVYGYKELYPQLTSNKKKQDLFQAPDLGSSLHCNIDIACRPAWADESKGIVYWDFIASGLIHRCSGALLNNVTGTNRPFILTAFHCIDDNKDGALSPTEKDFVQSAYIAFNCKKSICGGAYPTSWVSYNYADFRAGNSETDFLLMETKQTIKHNDVSFLGWDKLSNNLGQGICIHHPEGDVMKISFDNSSVSTAWYPVLIQGLWYSGSKVWELFFDQGAIQGGSSGSPLFDQHQRIKGQLIGGLNGADCEPWFKYYGAFYQSWSSGNADTELKSWLDPYNTGTDQLNTIGYCQTTNFWNNKIVNRKERIICKDINVKDVTVKNGSTLELESINGSVKIESGFTVEAGASFVIK